MTVNIYSQQTATTYFVEWLDVGGCTRSRQFSSYRAAQRYAEQVERRLLNEIAGDLQILNQGAR